MGFTQSVKTCLSKYIVFSGRAGRSEYWWFFLFAILISTGLAILDAVVFGKNSETGQGPNILNSVFQLAIFLPMLAAGWRRLHDTGRPGWYLLLPLACGFATMIVLLTGVAVFSVVESGSGNPEALRGPAALIGGTGLMLMFAIQLGFLILMFWWLTRPSQEGTNVYGAQP